MSGSQELSEEYWSRTNFEGSFYANEDLIPNVKLSILSELDLSNLHELKGL